MQQTVADEAQYRPQHREERNIDQVRRICEQALPQEERADAQTQNRRKDRRAAAAREGGIDDDRHINHCKRAVFEILMEQETEHKYQYGSSRRRPITKPEAAIGLSSNDPIRHDSGINRVPGTLSIPETVGFDGGKRAWLVRGIAETQARQLLLPLEIMPDNMSHRTGGSRGGPWIKLWQT